MLILIIIKLITILILTVTICLSSVPIVERCTNETSVDCAYTDSNTTTILIFGENPTGLCYMVQIGNRKFIYDPIMINSVWITIVNTDQRCVADLESKAKSNYSSLIDVSNEEVVILSSTSGYDRIILVKNGRQIDPFSIEFEMRLKSTNKIKLYPIYNNLNIFGPYCLNNGTIDTTYTGAGYKCICPETFSGPNCEIMERKNIVRQDYFNVFQNEKNIFLKFSLLSGENTGTQSILSIKDNYFNEFIEIIRSESNFSFLVKKEKIFDFNYFSSKNWHDIYLEISQENATIMINSTMKSKNLTYTSSLNFKSFYLVLNKVTVNSKICIKNLIINSKVINLGGPGHESCCKDKCPCTPIQSCECNHHLTKNYNLNCHCPYIDNSTVNTICQEPVDYIQIDDSISLNNNLVFNKIETLYLRFRTLSVNGNILKILNSITNIVLSIQIINSHLTLYITDQVQQSITCDVSNGLIHTIFINVKKYSVELILDNNKNHTAAIINWFNSSSFNSLGEQVTLSLGEMKKPYNNSLNTLTTCISSIQLNIMENIQNININNMNGPKKPGCSDGPRCVNDSISCPTNQVCKDDEWQNTKCVCIPKFSLVNSSCVYNLCIINPCNKGACKYNPDIDSYSCECIDGYNGKNCEILISSAQLWWIAILVILLIILVILLIYFFYFRKDVQLYDSNITEVYENMVIYNDQAGESDYNGPTIKMNMLCNAINELKEANNDQLYKVIPDLLNKKEEMERNNEDIILDHPLEYGYEGYNTDNGSISSIGSKSQNSYSDNIYCYSDA